MSMCLLNMAIKIIYAKYFDQYITIFVFTIPDNNKAMSQCMMWKNNHIMTTNTSIIAEIIVRYISIVIDFSNYCFQFVFPACFQH